MKWKRLFRSLADKHNWTFEQIAGLTWAQFLASFGKPENDPEGRYIPGGFPQIFADLQAGAL